jgi:hypothetical protein
VRTAKQARQGFAWIRRESCCRCNTWYNIHFGPGEYPTSKIALASPIEEIVAFFAGGPSRDAIASFRLSKDAQEYISALLDKSRSGTLTSDEDRELDRVMALNEVISLIQARARTTKAHPLSSSTSANLPGA